jgi:hypothetical protein
MPTLMAAGNVPPPMKPMAPPPGMAPPPPMGYMPPPPAPPASGGVPWKWIFVGCGCVVAIIVLVCGGMGVWAYLFAKDMQDTVLQIQNHPRVQDEVGTPCTAQPGGRQVQNPDQSVTQTWTARGPKGSVDLEVTMKLESMRMKITDVTLITKDGDRVPIPRR